MHLVHRAGVEPILPQVAAATVKAVDVLRVEIMRATHGLRQRILGVREGNQMDVVGHQAVPDDL